MSNSPLGISKGTNVRYRAVAVTSADGVTWTDDATIGLIAFDGCVEEHSEQTEMVSEPASPSDCGYTNNVQTELVTSINIQEFGKQYAMSVSTGNKLRALLRVSTILRILVEEFSDANPGRASSTGFLGKTIYYVRFKGFSKQAPKGPCKFNGDFETIAVSDGSGGYKANPYFTTTYATVDIP